MLRKKIIRHLLYKPKDFTACKDIDVKYVTSDLTVTYHTIHTYLFSYLFMLYFPVRMRTTYG